MGQQIWGFPNGQAIDADQNLGGLTQYAEVTLTPAQVLSTSNQAAFIDLLPQTQPGVFYNIKQVVIEILSNTGTTDYTFGGTYAGSSPMFLTGSTFNYQIGSYMFAAASSQAPGTYCIINGPGLNMVSNASDFYSKVITASASAPDYLQFGTWGGVTISDGDFPVTFKIWYQLLKLG
jgi:hypothetical protein